MIASENQNSENAYKLVAPKCGLFLEPFISTRAEVEKCTNASKAEIRDGLVCTFQ